MKVRAAFGSNAIALPAENAGHHAPLVLTPFGHQLSPKGVMSSPKGIESESADKLSARKVQISAQSYRTHGPINILSLSKGLASEAGAPAYLIHGSGSVWNSAMRFVLLAAALLAAWYYFSGAGSAPGTLLLQSVENTAGSLWAALPRPGKQAEQALQDARQRLAALDSELSQLRGRLTQADAEAAARTSALETVQAALKAREEAEHSAAARAETLDAQLAAAGRERHDAMLGSETLRKQIGETQARADALSRDNRLLHDRLDGASLQIAAADKSRATLESDLRAAAQQTQQQQDHAQALASDLDRLREATASEIRDLQGQLNETRMRAAKAEEAVLSQADPAPEGAHTNAPEQTASAAPEPIVPQAAAKLGRDSLVEGAPTRVVVRFSSANAAAKAHAIRLCTTLQAEGILIEQLIGAPSTLQADSLAYFYKDDESRAARVATLFPEFRSTMRQRALEDRIPRPGLIEIEVAT